MDLISGLECTTVTEHHGHHIYSIIIHPLYFAAGLVKISVKVFLGMEYECGRGHRFLSSAPDRLMKQGSNPNRYKGRGDHMITIICDKQWPADIICDQILLVVTSLYNVLPPACRETSAAKVVNADMPLYMACPCR